MESNDPKVNILGPGYSYISLMDHVVTERGTKQDKKFPLRPSAAGYCARKLAHDLNAFKGNEEYAEEDRKPNVHRLLSLGHYIEEQVLDELAGTPDLFVVMKQQQVDFFKLNDGHQIKGSLDAVLWSEEHKCVMDAKSMKDNHSNGFYTKWKELNDSYSKMPGVTVFGESSFYVDDLDTFLPILGTDDALYKNIIQVNGYACTEFLKSRGIDHGSIVRYNKNTSELMEFRFRPSQKLFDYVQRKFNQILFAVDQGDVTLVEKERVLGQLDCTYCPHKAKCWPSARKSDFYAGTKAKQWATKTSEMPNGENVEKVMSEVKQLENVEKLLTEAKREAILLLGDKKVKLNDGSVWEVKTLAKSAELRRSKE